MSNKADPGTLVLAIDQGTSSTKAVIVDASGDVVAHASVPLSQSHPAEGWVEQDPDELLASVLEPCTTSRHRASTATSRRLGSAVSESRRSRGIVAPAKGSVPSLAGRTGEPQAKHSACRRRVLARKSAPRPAFRSTPCFPRSNSRGFSTPSIPIARVRVGRHRARHRRLMDRLSLDGRTPYRGG